MRKTVSTRKKKKTENVHGSHSKGFLLRFPSAPSTRDSAARLCASSSSKHFLHINVPCAPPVVKTAQLHPFSDLRVHAGFKQAQCIFNSTLPQTRPCLLASQAARFRFLPVFRVLTLHLAINASDNTSSETARSSFASTSSSRSAMPQRANASPSRLVKAINNVEYGLE